MKPTVRIRVLLTNCLTLIAFTCFFTTVSHSQASCSAAAPLTPSVNCVITTGDLQGAVNALPAGSCGGATSTTTNGVWYYFTATSSNATVTLTVPAAASNLTAATTYVEVLSGTCSPVSFTVVACGAATAPLNLTGLTTGANYFVRVYVTGSTTSGGNPNRRGIELCVQSSPNDNCGSALILTSGIICVNTTGSLIRSTATPGLPVGCETAGTHYDVWYSFTAANTSHTATLSARGTNFTNPEIQIYSGTCLGLTSLNCGTTAVTATGLTIGNTYYVRVSNVGSSPATNGEFDICITHPAPPPANDECAGAISLTPGTNCSNIAGNLAAATVTAGLPAGCESVGAHYDVWYKFVAANTYELVSISNNGTNFTNPEVQIYSGACGTLVSLACGTTSAAVGSLTIGATYYVRVSNVGSSMSTNGAFNICVSHPASATYDFGKSYVNITRNSGGGTINPGDTLEVRATLVIRSQSLDSLAFYDTLRAGGGLRLVPGSIALRTNEGKVYKSFTDGFDTDAGHFTVAGADTAIRINMGVNSSNVARGRLTSTSKPSVFGSTCIIMATYRVVVYSGYSATVNLGGGAISIRDGVTTIQNKLNFNNRNAIIYSSPGLCPGPVAATNAIGGDFNGTFGTPAVSAPLARNRGTSTNVLGYIYKPFVTGGGPNDYYYGIANNTSATYTTLNSWPKSDSRRVFNVWDITGDHTGATNPLKGNNPCDTTLPVSPTNPCGYMLVINSAYKTDTAFQYAVTNLCPNTYYEISAWIKNICSKCSCDSNGVAATSGAGSGYIPFATGDSSGIQPNLAFDINGTDYYSTGNIPHTGSVANMQRGSDSTNQWFKRGFTYVTGPAQTSFTLTIRNNAPGGGGNDWALDDISLATCLPNMNYSPSLSPTVCDSNYIVVYDTIRSYFNNYNYYRWQRSIDAGASWTDVSPAQGPITPVWNGSSWEYITSYTVPPTATNLSNNGDRYRLIVATTSTNLGNGNCQVTDGVSLISLNVIDCMVPLSTEFISFAGSLVNQKPNLLWTTSRSVEPTFFTVEKSLDGISFTPIGTLENSSNFSSEINSYSFIDPAHFAGKAWYRITMSNNNGRKKYSRIILLNTVTSDFSLVKVVNPFSNELVFNIESSVDRKVEVSLRDLFGKTVKKQSLIAYSGTNSLALPETGSLPSGIYILEVRNTDKLLTQKVIKK